MEIGICLIPEEYQKHHLQTVIKTLDPNPLKNIPHISLFQMKISKTKVSQVIDMASFWKDVCPFVFKALGIHNRYGNTGISLESEEASFVCFKKKIIESFKDLRSETLLSQINIKKLTSKEKELVKNFGIYWGVGDKIAETHLTLCYGSSVSKSLLDLQSLRYIRTDHMALGKLGFQGNIEEIIKLWPLKNEIVRKVVYDI